MSYAVTADYRPTQRRGLLSGWIGAELDPRGLKLAVIEETPRGVSVLAADRISWPSDADITGVDEFGDVLEAALKDWRRRRPENSTSAVACSLPDDWLRTAQVAQQDRDEEATDRQAVELAGRLGGATADETAWDYWVTPFQLESSDGQPSGAGTLTVSVADAETVTLLDRTFRRCGLELHVIDVAPLTTARAAAMASSERSTLAVAWDVDGLTLTWLMDGAPVFTRRTSTVPLQRVFDELRTSFELDDEGCRRLLALYGMTGRDPNAGNLSRSIDRRLAGLLDEIEHEIDRTVRFLEQRQSTCRIDGCLLLGDGAAIRGLPQELAARTDRPTRRWELTAVEDRPCSTVELTAFAHPVALSALPLLAKGEDA